MPLALPGSMLVPFRKQDPLFPLDLEADPAVREEEQA